MHVSNHDSAAVPPLLCAYTRGRRRSGPPRKKSPKRRRRSRPHFMGMELSLSFSSASVGPSSTQAMPPPPLIKETFTRSLRLLSMVRLYICQSAKWQWRKCLFGPKDLWRMPFQEVHFPAELWRRPLWRASKGKRKRKKRDPYEWEEDGG